MGVVLQSLFMEQRSGLRSTLVKSKSKQDVRDPAMLARAALIRSNIYVHLSNTFPKIQDVMIPFMNGSCYAALCGVDATGKRVSDTVVAEDTDDESQTAPFTS